MSEENEGLRSPWSELVTLATRVAEERRELVAAYNAVVDELRRCSARRMRAEARLAALTAQEPCGYVLNGSFYKTDPREAHDTGLSVVAVYTREEKVK